MVNMKLTNAIIYNSLPVLRTLNTTKLPIKTSYKVNKNIRALQSKLDFVEEQRTSLIRKYGTEEENGSINVGIDKMEAFYKDFNEVLEIEEDVKLQLKQLNHSLLATYLTIINRQIERPYEPDIIRDYVDHFQFLIEQIHKLLNAYRPIQAKKYYVTLFEKQVEQKEKLYKELKTLIDESNARYKDYQIKSKPMEEC